MENLIYLYGIIPAENNEESAFQSFKGLDEQHDVYTIGFDNVKAVVCDLDSAEYGQEELEKKTNDAKWLHAKALHHHEALMTLYQNYPLIPMKFCTIYSSQDSLQKIIDQHEQQMVDLLDMTRRKEEWLMKLYCDEDKVRDTVAESNENVEAKKEEIAALSPGRQYLEKRKLEHTIDEEADKEKQRFGSDLHDELKAYSTNTEVKKNWNKDVTGRKDEMCWNSVYLLEKSTVDDFLTRVTELENKWEDSGWRLEVTGPWPSYHFAKIG